MMMEWNVLITVSGWSVHIVAGRWEEWKIVSPGVSSWAIIYRLLKYPWRPVWCSGYIAHWFDDVSYIRKSVHHLYDQIDLITSNLADAILYL